MSDSQLSVSRLIVYALPAIPLAALTLPLYSFIPTFYAETLGLPLAGIGFALFLVRAFDAVNDPVAGILADRFRPVFGRRRAWFVASIPLVIVGVWRRIIVRIVMLVIVNVRRREVSRLYGIVII